MKGKRRRHRLVLLWSNFILSSPVHLQQATVSPQAVRHLQSVGLHQRRIRQHTPRRPVRHQMPTIEQKHPAARLQDQFQIVRRDHAGAAQGMQQLNQLAHDMAGIVLYAALFEPDVARLDLWHPPASHRQGPIFLNVLRVLDMPQAVALSFPRTVRLYVKDDAEAKAWQWPMQLQKALAQDHLQIRQVGE